jgi:hypothetical protein
MQSVQGPEEPEPGAVPVEPRPGGAGLTEHAALDPFPRSAGLVSGVVALAVTVAVAGAFWFLNPAFSSGRAGGMPGQLAPPLAISGSPSASASPSAAVSASPAAVNASPSAVSASPAALSASPAAAPSPSPRGP